MLDGSSLFAIEGLEIGGGHLVVNRSVAGQLINHLSRFVRNSYPGLDAAICGESSAVAPRNRRHGARLPNIWWGYERVRVAMIQADFCPRPQKSAGRRRIGCRHSVSAVFPCRSLCLARAGLSPAFPDQKAISPSLGRRVLGGRFCPHLSEIPAGASRRLPQHIRLTNSCRSTGASSPRDSAWLPAPVLIARVLHLVVTQLENWTHGLVASPFRSATMRAPGRRKNHGSHAAACVTVCRSRLAADAGAIDRGVR